MTLTPGARLGPYEILAPLGAGGMGEVYRARDPRLGREVAIKVLPAEVTGDPERLQRFEQEARAASALNHSAILTVHDVGTEGGVPFLVTELLEGATLRDRLRDGPLSPNRAVEIAAALARGLAAAHEKGIVHRDLKPENVFLTSDGAVKILDFGLARVDRPELAGGDLHAASTVLETREGTVLGTVGYMAPEQVRGQRADSRSDLFALGVVLHEMLAGSNPFQRESIVESLNAILKEEAPDLAAAAGTVDSALGRIVGRLLAKAPASRFQSARDLAFALDSLTLAAHPHATAEPRRTLPKLLAAAAIVLAAAGASWLFRSQSPAAAPAGAPLRSLAVLPFGDLSAEGASHFFADGMTDALTTELARLAELKVIASNSTARFRESTLRPAEIARELEVEGLVGGTVVRSGQRARISAQLTEARSGRLLWAESYERDLRDVLSLQGEVARSIARAIALELTPIEAGRLAARRPVDPRALDEYLTGRALWSRRTQQDVRAALAHFQTATAIDPEFALGHTGIADAYVILAAYGGMAPLEAAPLALAAFQRATALDPGAGEPHASRGDLAFHVERDFEVAEREFDRAIELAPGYATAYHWRAELSIARDRVDEALRFLRRAVELDPYAPTPRTDLGRALELAGQKHEAEQAHQLAIELAPRFPRPRVELMLLHLRSGRFDEALTAAHDIAALMPLPAGQAILGTALAEAGELAEARALFARVREAASRNEIPSIQSFRLAASLGDRDAALASLREAMGRRDFWVSELANRRLFELEYPRLSADAEIEGLLSTIGTRR